MEMWFSERHTDNVKFSADPEMVTSYLPAFVVPSISVLFTTSHIL